MEENKEKIDLEDNTKNVGNNKNKWFIVLGLLAVVAIVLVIVFAIPHNNNVDPIPDEPVGPDIPEEVVQPERELWLANKAINMDYLGEIVFDSGIINKSFVQAKDVYDSYGNLYNFYTERGKKVTDPTGYTGNDVYIWTNWKDMTYDYNILGGSVFVDYRNEINTDQNIIIYGHHFSEAGGNDPERNKAFTPLEQYLKKDYEYDGDDEVRLILDNETRIYQLSYVFKYDVDDAFCIDNLQYYRCNYDYDEFEGVATPDYYDTYIKAMEQKKLFETDYPITNEDKTLTLQTCISGLTGFVYEICVFKLVDVIYY